MSAVAVLFTRCECLKNTNNSFATKNWTAGSLFAMVSRSEPERDWDETWGRDRAAQTIFACTATMYLKLKTVN